MPDRRRHTLFGNEFVESRGRQHALGIIALHGEHVAARLRQLQPYHGFVAATTDQRQQIDQLPVRQDIAQQDDAIAPNAPIFAGRAMTDENRQGNGLVRRWPKASRLKPEVMRIGRCRTDQRAGDRKNKARSHHQISDSMEST